MASISSAIISILSIRPSTHVTEEKTNYLADIPITGSGEPLPTCGLPITIGCLNVKAHKGITLDGLDIDGKAYVKRVHRRCHRLACPKCYPSAIKREVARAMERFVQFEHFHPKIKAIHVTASVPKSDYALPLKNMRKNAIDALKKTGFLGGAVWYHPRRFYHGQGYYSPHFHAVGYGWIEGTAKYFTKTGYVVRNHRVRKSLAGTLKYELSHCGIEDKKHAVTWIGALSYNKLHIEPHKKKEAQKCPFCGEELKHLFYKGDFKNYPLEEVEGATALCDPSDWEVIERGRFGGYDSEE